MCFVEGVEKEETCVIPEVEVRCTQSMRGSKEEGEKGKKNQHLWVVVVVMVDEDEGA